MSELHRFERVQRRTNDLDVFLRHRLLRQPGGFEGLRLRRESLQANDHPVAEPKDVCLVPAPGPRLSSPPRPRHELPLPPHDRTGYEGGPLDRPLPDGNRTKTLEGSAEIQELRYGYEAVDIT